MKRKIFSPNEFILLLTLSGFLIFLTVMILNFSQKQDVRSKAYQSAGCNSNRDCPKSTACRGGLCIIATPMVTQTPLVYQEVNKIIQPPTTIPAIYDSPTPTPQANFLMETSVKINAAVGSIYSLFFGFFETIVTKIAELLPR